MLVTVRLPGARMAPTSRISAWCHVRWRKSGAKDTMIAAKRAGRCSMAASLGGNAARLPHRSLRRPALPNTHQKWPNSSLEYAIKVAATDYPTRVGNENFIKKPDTRLTSHHPTGAGFDG